MTQYPVREQERIQGRSTKEEMKTILQEEVKNTYVELNHVRDGQQPSQSLNVTYQKDFATKGWENTR